MHFADTMIRKLFILGLVLAVCLGLTQGKPSPQAKVLKYMTLCVCVYVCMHASF